jgi:hypothetical protein
MATSKSTTVKATAAIEGQRSVEVELDLTFPEAGGEGRYKLNDNWVRDQLEDATLSPAHLDAIHEWVDDINDAGERLEHELFLAQGLRTRFSAFMEAQGYRPALHLDDGSRIFERDRGAGDTEAVVFRVLHGLEFQFKDIPGEVVDGVLTGQGPKVDELAFDSFEGESRPLTHFLSREGLSRPEEMTEELRAWRRSYESPEAIPHPLGVLARIERGAVAPDLQVSYAEHFAQMLRERGFVRSGRHGDLPVHTLKERHGQSAEEQIIWCIGADGAPRYKHFEGRITETPFGYASLDAPERDLPGFLAQENLPADRLPRGFTPSLPFSGEALSRSTAADLVVEAALPAPTPAEEFEAALLSAGYRLHGFSERGSIVPIYAKSTLDSQGPSEFLSWRMGTDGSPRYKRFAGENTLDEAGGYRHLPGLEGDLGMLLREERRPVENDRNTQAAVGAAQMVAVPTGDLDEQFLINEPKVFAALLEAQGFRHVLALDDETVIYERQQQGASNREMLAFRVVDNRLIWDDDQDFDVAFDAPKDAAERRKFTANHWLFSNPRPLLAFLQREGLETVAEARQELAAWRTYSEERLPAPTGIRARHADGRLSASIEMEHARAFAAVLRERGFAFVGAAGAHSQWPVFERTGNKSERLVCAIGADGEPRFKRVQERDLAGQRYERLPGPEHDFPTLLRSEGLAADRLPAGYSMELPLEAQPRERGSVDQLAATSAAVPAQQVPEISVAALRSKWGEADGPANVAPSPAWRWQGTHHVFLTVQGFQHKSSYYNSATAALTHLYERPADRGRPAGVSQLALEFDEAGVATWKPFNRTDLQLRSGQPRLDELPGAARTFHELIVQEGSNEAAARTTAAAWKAWEGQPHVQEALGRLIGLALPDEGLAVDAPAPISVAGQRASETSQPSLPDPRAAVTALLGEHRFVSEGWLPDGSRVFFRPHQERSSDSTGLPTGDLIVARVDEQGALRWKATTREEIRSAESFAELKHAEQDASVLSRMRGTDAPGAPEAAHAVASGGGGDQSQKKSSAAKSALTFDLNRLLERERYNLRATLQDGTRIFFQYDWRRRPELEDELGRRSREPSAYEPGGRYEQLEFGHYIAVPSSSRSLENLQYKTLEPEEVLRHLAPGYEYDQASGHRHLIEIAGQPSFEDLRGDVQGFESFLAEQGLSESQAAAELKVTSEWLDSDVPLPPMRAIHDRRGALSTDLRTAQHFVALLQERGFTIEHDASKYFGPFGSEQLVAIRTHPDASKNELIAWDLSPPMERDNFGDELDRSGEEVAWSLLRPAQQPGRPFAWTPGPGGDLDDFLKYEGLPTRLEAREAEAEAERVAAERREIELAHAHELRDFFTAHLLEERGFIRVGALPNGTPYYRDPQSPEQLVAVGIHSGAENGGDDVYVWKKTDEREIAEQQPYSFEGLWSEWHTFDNAELERLSEPPDFHEPLAGLREAGFRAAGTRADGKLVFEHGDAPGERLVMGFSFGEGTHQKYVWTKVSSEWRDPTAGWDWRALPGTRHPFTDLETAFFHGLQRPSELQVAGLEGMAAATDELPNGLAPPRGLATADYEPTYALVAAQLPKSREHDPKAQRDQGAPALPAPVVASTQGVSSQAAGATSEAAADEPLAEESPHPLLGLEAAEEQLRDGRLAAATEPTRFGDPVRHAGLITFGPEIAHTSRGEFHRLVLWSMDPAGGAGRPISVMFDAPFAKDISQLRPGDFISVDGFGPKARTPNDRPSPWQNWATAVALPGREEPVVPLLREGPPRDEFLREAFGVPHLRRNLGTIASPANFTTAMLEPSIRIGTTLDAVKLAEQLRSYASDRQLGLTSEEAVRFAFEQRAPALPASLGSDLHAWVKSTDRTPGFTFETTAAALERRLSELPPPALDQFDKAGIEPATLEAPQFKGLLRMGQHGVVSLSVDRQGAQGLLETPLDGAAGRATIVAGNDDGVWISAPGGAPCTKIVVTPTPLIALACHQRHPDPGTRYIAVGGDTLSLPQRAALRQLLEDVERASPSKHRPELAVAGHHKSTGQLLLQHVAITCGNHRVKGILPPIALGGNWLEVARRVRSPEHRMDLPSYAQERLGYEPLYRSPDGNQIIMGLPNRKVAAQPMVELPVSDAKRIRHRMPTQSNPTAPQFLEQLAFVRQLDGSWQYQNDKAHADDRGTAADFARTRLQLSIEDFRADVRRFDMTREFKNVVELAPAARDVNLRGIYPDTIADACFAGTLRQDSLGRLVYSQEDGKGMCGYSRASLEGGRPDHIGARGVWLSNPSPDRTPITKLVVVDHPMTALAYHQQNPARGVRYIAAEGPELSNAQKAALRAVVVATKRDRPDANVELVVATSGDRAGREFTSEITHALTVKEGAPFPVKSHTPAFGRDWNESVKKRERDFIRSLGGPREAESLGL